MSLRIHLYSTDISAFRIVDKLKNKFTIKRIFIPENRIRASKTVELKKEAKRRGIAVSAHLKKKSQKRKLEKADIGISWFYSQILSKKDIECYSIGAINMHGGKIPDYRGANVLQWAIINGEKQLGVTWHSMVQKVDAGPILAEGTVSLTPRMNAWRARGLIINEGIALLDTAIANLLGGIVLRKPDLRKGRLWPGRRPQNGEIKPGMPEHHLRNLVRALCPPWPGAFIKTKSGKKRILSVRTSPQKKSISYETDSGKKLYLVPADM